MTATTATVTVAITDAIPARATYLRHVLEHGHQAGVLSGAELRGKARRYASYWGARARASRVAAEHGVRSDLVLSATRRWTRVWTLDGQPVQLVLATAPSVVNV
jgi:hypothetical protein